MNTQIYDEAAEWLVELETEEADAKMRGRFAAWLDSSPEHVRAFLEATSLWEDSVDFDKRRALDVDALMAAVKTERNLFPLDVVSYRLEADAPGGPWSAPRVRRWRVALAASVAVLATSAAGAWYWTSHWRGVHGTEIREQRTLALEDGTTVELNADTRIRERFTDTERAVDLLQGQALFRVAKDATRPFVVRSDAMSVRAIGTEFDVHRRATGTTVTVLEGRVAVLPIAEDQDTPVLLGAGELLSLHEGKGAAAPERADMKMATAWTQKRIAFEFANLADAAEEFNRFNTRKVIVDPAGIEDFKVSGTFQALDPESLERFIRFLRDQPGLSVVERDDEIAVKRNR
jgi:transmembrane sensor